MNTNETDILEPRYIHYKMVYNKIIFNYDRSGYYGI